MRSCNARSLLHLCIHGPGQFLPPAVQADGKCASLEEKRCPLGWYLDAASSAEELAAKAYHCDKCPAGTFGDRDDLRTYDCSGVCAAGYYCPEGSTSPVANRCGGVGVFCPKGSGAPRTVGAGYYSVREESAGARGDGGGDEDANEHGDGSLKGEGAAGDRTPGVTGDGASVLVSPAKAKLYHSGGRGVGTANAAAPGGGAGMSAAEAARVALWEETRTGQRLCEPGTFCEGGEVYYCPAGVYGSDTGLASPLCTGRCFAGTYCPPGSAEPLTCPPGYYCPEGEKRWPCPAGTFGAFEGLASPSCSGLCYEGHYCDRGSVRQRPCPAGVYGAVSIVIYLFSSGAIVILIIIM